jgi:hypothetical protein
MQVHGNPVVMGGAAQVHRAPATAALEDQQVQGNPPVLGGAAQTVAQQYQRLMTCNCKATL